MSYRIERLNSEMQKSLINTILNKLNDSRIVSMVNVTKVDCAKDLKTAKVYISVFGGSEEEKKSTFQCVSSSASFIRKELAADFKDIRTVPQLTFILDESGEYGNRIDTLLAELKSKK